MRGFLGCSVPAIVLGVLFAAGADLAVGLSRPGAQVQGCSGWFIVLATALAQASVLAAVLIGLIGLVRLLDRGPRIRLPWPVRGSVGGVHLLVAAAIVGAFEYLNWDLWKGGGISKKSWASTAEAIFRYAGGLGVWLAAVAAQALVLKTGKENRPGVSWLIAVVCGLLTVAVIYANATVHPNNPGYAQLHLQLSGLAALLGMGAVHFAMKSRVATGASVGRPRLGWLLLGLIMILTITGGVARSHAQYRALKAPLLRFRTTTDWAPLADRFLGKFVTPKEIESVDVSAILQRLRGRRDNASVEAEVAKLLPTRSRMNVLWVALDTVRADHVSAYGHKNRTTPNLDALAEEGFLFEQAWTAYPTSNYSYSSLLTSLPARITPAYSIKYSKPWKFGADQAFPSLLKERGLSTFAVNGFDRKTATDPQWFGCLRDGFEAWNPDQQDAGMQAPAITASAMGAIDRVLHRQWFGWVHYLDPHDPYVRHPEFDFGTGIKADYDSDIAWTDHHMGMLFAHLKKTGVWDNTIIVVFSDHGEEFLERGGKFHNSSVYEEQVRIPLVIRVPGLKGRRIQSAVSLLDIVPTLTRLLDTPDQSRRFGRSLLPLMLGGEDEDGGLAFSEWFEVRLGAHENDAFAVVLGKKKYISKPQRDIVEMFDLAADPGERQSLAGKGDPSEAQLAGLLKDWMNAVREHHGREAPVEPLSEKVDRLLTEVETRVKTPTQVAEELRKALLNGYDAYSDTALRTIGAEELAKIGARIAAICDDRGLKDRAALVTILASSRDPSLRDWWAQHAKNKTLPALQCYVALSLIGDDSGREMLALALEMPILAQPQDVANALARMGDVRSLPWLRMNVSVQRFGRFLRDGILALPAVSTHIGLPSRWIRDRVFLEEGRHAEVNHAVLDILEPCTDEDARRMILLFCRDRVESVRVRALALAARRWAPDVLERDLAALDHELAADQASLYGQDQWPEAVRHYREAIGMGSFGNVHARLRLGRALHGARRHEEAVAVYTEIENDAEAHPLDRDIAKRFKHEQSVWPNFGDWKPEVTGEITLPEKIQPSSTIAVTVGIKNAGEKAWAGGWYRPNWRMIVGWLDEAGTLHHGARGRIELNPLPELGVLGGESTVLPLLAPIPEKDGEYTLVLRMESYLGELPDKGIFFRDSKKLIVGK